MSHDWDFCKKETESPLERIIRIASRASADVFCVVDAEGRFRGANRQYCDLLGFTHDELLSISLADVIPGFPGLDHSFFSKPRIRCAHRKKDAEEIDLQVSIEPIELDERLFVVHVEDPGASRDTGDYLHAVDALLKLFGQTSSRAEYLDSVVDLVQEWSGCRCVGIRVLDEDGGMFYGSHKGFSQAFWASENWLSVDEDECACTRVIREEPEPQDLPVMTRQGSYCYQDVQEYLRSLPEAGRNRFRGACAGNGFRSLALIPVRYRDRMVGMVHIADERPGMISFKLIGFLESLTPLMGEAIRKFNTEEELQHNHAIQSLMNSLLHISFEDIHLDEILDRSLSLIMDVSWMETVSGGSIFLVEDTPDALVLKAKKGLADTADGACTSPLRRFRHRPAALGKEYLPEGHPADPGYARGTCECTEYCIPILSSERILGLLKLHVEKGRRPPGRRQIEHLAAVANTLAGIILRKQAEESLKQSEARYRAIVQSQTELVSRFSPDGILTFVNDAYCRYFGETRDELLGYKLWHHVPAEERDLLQDYIASLTPENPAGMIEHRVVTSDGAVRWQQWTDRAIHDENGKLIEIQATGRDISERKAMEQALIESQDRLRALSAQLIIAQENERKRIARELHDSIGQYLAAIKFRLESTIKEACSDSYGMHIRALEGSVGTVQMAIDEVRRIMTDLRPSILDDLGIVATIRWFCREFQKIYSNIHVNPQVEIDEDEMPESLKIVVFRVLQEALNNIAKHSHAQVVNIFLGRNNGRIELAIADNGQGFQLPAEPSLRGHGLTSMRERVELSGGAFFLETTLDTGTVVRASWPSSSK